MISYRTILSVEKFKRELLKQIRKIRERGKTAQPWVHYHELIAIAMHFIQAELKGNWNFYIDCVRVMKSICHATGLLPYAIR